MTPLLHLLLDAPSASADTAQLTSRGVCVHDAASSCDTPVDVVLHVGTAVSLDRVAQGTGAVVLGAPLDLEPLGIDAVGAPSGTVLAAREDEIGCVTDEDLLAR